MDKVVVFVIITSLTSAMEEAKTDNVERLKLEADIIARYPGYFKTKEEATVMERHLQKLQHEFSKKKKASFVYHACCSSSSKAVNYETLKDVDGNTVYLADFHDRKQYFPTETCITLPNCLSCKCRCAMVHQLFTALVYNPDYPNNDDDEIILKFVQAPTFCRCYNNLPLEDETQDDEDEDIPEMPETSHDTEL